jgi:hypothetical protein
VVCQGCNFARRAGVIIGDYARARGLQAWPNTGQEARCEAGQSSDWPRWWETSGPDVDS